MNDREQRVAANEVLFSKVNEQIVDLGDTLLTDEDELSILCECGFATCEERLLVRLEDYRRVQQHPARFALLPAHLLPDLEHVVAEHDGWVVVEKDEPVKSALEE